MTRDFVSKLEEIYSCGDAIKEGAFTPLHVDTLRRILSMLLDSQSIARVVLAIDNLRSAFATLRENLKEDRIADKIFCVDTSEMMSRIFPSYNWYFCLRSVFNDKKSFKFFLAPWFLIETLDTIRKKINRAYNKEDARAFDELKTKEEVADFFRAFSLDIADKHIYLKNSSWDTGDLETRCISAVRDVCGRHRGAYVADKLGDLLAKKVVQSMVKSKVIDSLEEFNRFSDFVRERSDEVISFRESLVENRSYVSASHDMKSGKYSSNLAFDTISYVFCNWVLRTKSFDRDRLLLLSRDSLFRVANEWSVKGASYARCFNPQTLFLFWSVSTMRNERREIDNACGKSIEGLDAVAEMLGDIFARGKSFKLEAVERIFDWFKRRGGSSIIESDIRRAAKVLAEWTGEVVNDSSIRRFTHSIKGVEKNAVDNKEDFFKTAITIVSEFERIRDNFGENISPIFDDVGTWARQVVGCGKLYQKMS